MIAGTDELNGGDRILRTPDLGHTWREIKGNGLDQVWSLEPDSEHPGLVRAFGGHILRFSVFTAEDDSYQWKTSQFSRYLRERRKNAFSRNWSSSTYFFTYDATLANYFTHDFGESASVPGLEIVPAAPRFTFSKGVPVVVPIRVVLHYDADAALQYGQPADAPKATDPKPVPPTIRFADRPGELDFWGVRVLSSRGMQEKIPEDRATYSTVGRSWTTPRLDHQAFNLTPDSPYARVIDLSRLADFFSRPGEYRVQLVYNSGTHPAPDREEWDGYFTSPVFTVVIGD